MPSLIDTRKASWQLIISIVDRSFGLEIQIIIHCIISKSLMVTLNKRVTFHPSVMIIKKQEVPFLIFCRKTLLYKGNKNKMVSFSPQRRKQGNQNQNSRNIARLNVSGNHFQHQRKASHQKNKWQRCLNNSHYINNVQKHPKSGQLQLKFDLTKLNRSISAKRQLTRSS